MPTSPQDWEMVARLSLAALCGGLIGLEREMHSQPAGLRTHMVVAIGAALLMVVSIQVAGDTPTRDPGRIAAQVVSGIGFLGAGAILRFGMSVRGLTTAACLWTAAGIGLACGLGHWKGASTATVLVLVAIFVFDKIEKRFIVGSKVRRLVIAAREGPELMGKIEKVCGEVDLDVQRMGVHKDIVEKKIQITMIAALPPEVDLDTLTRSFSAIDEVKSIEIS